MPRHFRWLGKELEARCDPMGFRTTDTNSFTSSLDRSSSQALVSGCGSKSITWYLSSFLLSHTWNFNCYLIKHYYKGHKGYDVAAIACPEHHIVGLDISDVAIKKAVELSSSLPNASCFNFLMADFFTWSPIELFDLILDYTFFCAIEPDMRLAWAQRIRDILKPGGELITLMFPGFREIVDLPEWLGNLSSLQELYIVGCKYLVHLPTDEALRCLTKLKTLMIYECPKLSIEGSKIDHIPFVKVQDDGCTPCIENFAILKLLCMGEEDSRKNFYKTRYFQAKIGRLFQLQF